jgi:hypothetical protein
LWKTRTTPPGTGGISGRVRNQAGVAVPDAKVQVCHRSEIECTWHGTTDANGDYQVGELSDGEYLVRVYPPQGLAALPVWLEPVVISGASSLEQDVDLPGIAPLPSGAALSPSRQTSAGVPLIHWRQETQLTVQGCTDGSGAYQVLQDGVIVNAGVLIESASGQYSTNLDSLHPASGYAQVGVSITCPNTVVAQSDVFDIYVDPSGTVKNGLGRSIEGAQVTLYVFDPVTLSLTQVPEGDFRLSPVTSANPDWTDSAGHFGWDASAGAYVIRAQKEGCVSPSDPSLAYVQTGLAQSPYDMRDLALRLACEGETAQLFLPLVVQ